MRPLCFSIFISWYFHVLFPVLAYSQKPNHVQGEFIVQVGYEKDMEAFRKILLGSGQLRNSDIDMVNIMDQPLNLWKIKVDYTKVSTIDFENRLKSFDKFTYVGKNRLLINRLIPDDPDFAKQWQYLNTGVSGGLPGADIDMDLAWNITTGGLTPMGDTIVICVIDDGVNGNHEDLKDNLWFNHQEIPDNGIDDDRNGYIDDYRGWNITTNSDNVYSGGGHGTPVAGIAGARGNNGKGVSGVNWNVKLMIVNYGFSSEANALASYAYAYKMRKLYNESNGTKGAFVVATNASWGIDNKMASEAPLWCALYDSLGVVGILNCAATTNNDTDVDIRGDLPTSCPSEYLISVTNLTRNDEKLTNAGYGKVSVDIGAYGHQVYTLTRTGYGAFGGTSGATPHVAGVVGLLYAAPCTAFSEKVRSNPGAAALIAKDMILHGVLPNSSLANITTTGGRLNAFRSVSNLMTLCEPCSPPAGIYTRLDEDMVEIRWENDEGTANVSLRYREKDAGTWKEFKNIKSGKLITGLNYCTVYEFQLGSSCGFTPASYSYSKYVETAGCCVNPKVSNAGTDENSIRLSWDIQSNTTYLLQYKSIKDDWKDTLISDNKFTINDIPECQAFTFRLKAYCDIYGTSADFTSEFRLSTSCGNCTAADYCTFGAKDASQEWIETFTLAGMENTSGTSTSGYSNFAGAKNISLTAGKSYDFDIMAGYSGTEYQDYYKLYLDDNQDGVWDENEFLFKTPAAVRRGVSGVIEIPANAKDGYTRLRIIMSYEDFEGACDDIDFEYGEVEDYCVYIESDICLNDIKTKVLSVKAHEIKFGFGNLKGNQTGVLLSYRKFGDNGWTEQSGKDTMTIIGLDVCTLYEYSTSVMCGDSISLPGLVDTIRTACTNSINEPYSNVNVTPNPFTDRVKIIFSQASVSGGILKITDSAGKLIINKEILPGESIYELQMSQVPPGVYILEIGNIEGIKAIKKLIKMP